MTLVPITRCMYDKGLVHYYHCARYVYSIHIKSLGTHFAGAIRIVNRIHPNEGITTDVYLFLHAQSMYTRFTDPHSP
jgi:hypothetical protein